MCDSNVEAQSNDVIPLASTLDFHGVWRELKTYGWTSKPPRGLDNRYRYVLPGCAANGRSGHDFLLGEEAVLRHFVEHVAAADGDGGVVVGSGRVRGTGAAAEQQRAGSGRGARPAGVQVPAAAAATDGDGGVVVGSGRGRGAGAAAELRRVGPGRGVRAAGVQVPAAAAAAAAADGGVVIGSGRGRGARPAGVQVPAAAAAAAAADGDGGVVVGSGRVRGVGDDAGNGGAVIASPTISTSSAISTTPRNPTSLTSSIENLLLKKMVAFSPSKESWMQKKQNLPMYTMFQNAVEVVTIATVQRGIDNYQTLMRLPDKPAWRDLTDTMVGGELNLDLPLDELEIASEEEGYERYDPERSLPASLAEVEAVKSMRFEPELEMEAPSDLYAHTDDSTTTRLVPEYSSLFAHSASSSFFAYLPVYFWKQVVLESNRYAAATEIRITTPFSMEELMTFLGIMFYMTLTDKGEYSNYWESQTEDAIFGGASTSLDTDASAQIQVDPPLFEFS
ncbi:unnamed protein product [Phytophthora fragariaefolia]|uniref:Unnamed protein product n=1 Tax=Phytophthora fragariaefolia TaxID=1490495 RepID=A0A9W6U1D7_9STRA|nr:unnamed protein product [Phytophthora fragariaefolia]